MWPKYSIPLAWCILTGLKKGHCQVNEQNLNFRILEFVSWPVDHFKTIFFFAKIVQRKLTIFRKCGAGVPPCRNIRQNICYVHIIFCCISEMTSNTDLAVELDEMQSELQSHVSCINTAFSVLEARVSAWQLRRQEILRTEFKKILVKLKERDTVSKL